MEIKQIIDMLDDVRDDKGDIEPDCLPKGFSVVEEGDWEQDHKYQFSTIIVKYGEVYFQIDRSRSGSPFSDWYYGASFVNQVEPREETVVITKWVEVKHG